MDKKTIAEETAKIFLDTEAVHFNVDQPFVLTSGRQSPVYVDCRKLISFPDARRRLTAFTAEILKLNGVADRFDSVAGGETAGIAYAAWLADALDKPMIYVRKKPKGFGRQNHIEGVLDADQNPNVLLVEDLASEGSSKKLFVDVLRAAGATVTDISVLFYYGIFPSAPETFAALDVNLNYLTTWRDVLDFAKANNRFDTATLDGVERFLASPDTWQAA